MDQLTCDLGAHGGFKGVVVNISQHASLGAQFDPAARLDVAFHDAVQNDVRRHHRTLDTTLFAHRQYRAAIQLADEVAVDVAIEMKAAGKLDVAVDARLGAYQGVDLAAIRFPLEHPHHPWPHSPRFQPTSPVPSRRMPAARCGRCPCRYGSRLPPASARNRAATRSARRIPESNGRSMPG